MVPQANERRQCTRTPFKTTVLISTDEEELEVEADLLNISISGMYIEFQRNLPVGTLCSLQIVIAGRYSRLILDDIHGEVVRAEEGGIGIHFTSNMEWFVLFKIYTQYARDNSPM